MTTSVVLGIFAASIGSVMALSPLLQARSILRTRSSADVSVAAMWIFVINCVGWIAYGASISNLTIVLPNSIGLFSLSVSLTVAKKYRPSARASRMVAEGS